jgi:tetratricopeptide (TPR) repeat protein
VLNGGTCELGWGRRVTQIQRARQVQMSFALNRAVALNPRLAQAHFELAALYRSAGCVDLALEHLREYKRWVTPPATGDAAKAFDEQLEQLAKQVQARTEVYDKDTAKSSVSERAIRANQLELGGKALDLLLKSDVSAFGAQGAELELELLVRTGRPRQLLAVTDETPEVRGSIGNTSFHWLRAQAFLCLGDYDAADAEMRQMVGPDGRRDDPKQVISDFAEAVGNGVLDAQPGGLPLPHLVRFARSQTELYNRVAGASRSLGLEANMITVRGVMGLEAGRPERAAAVFREALAYSPSPWAVGGQLEFSGRSVAHDGLSLLGEK